MSMLKVEIYENAEAEKPYTNWLQTDTNPTAIADLLITIDDLEQDEKLIITKE